MSSHKSQRGAVHILFFVFALVVAVAGWGMWFMQLSENEDHVNRTEVARQQVEDLEQKLGFSEEAYRIVATRVGGTFVTAIPTDVDYTQPATEFFKPAIDQAERELRELRDRIKDPSAAPKTMRGAWDPILARLDAKDTKIGQLESDIARLNGELTEARNQKQQADATHQSTMDENRNEWTATNNRVSGQADTLRTENEDYASRNRELGESVDKARDDLNAEKQRNLVKERELEGKIQTIKRSLTIERKRELSDGKVLAADPATGMVFINRGGKDFLRRGTRFKVYATEKGGVKVHRGWIRVIDVSRDRAECKIDGTRPGPAIGAGDWIYNPYFTPGKQVRFTFIGELTGRYTREQVQAMLEKAGARVDKAVSIDTDFLVVGVSEDPDGNPITEDPSYRQAKAWGIEMVRVRDLEPFLKF